MGDDGLLAGAVLPDHDVLVAQEARVVDQTGEIEAERGAAAEERRPGLSEGVVVVLEGEEVGAGVEAVDAIFSGWARHAILFFPGESQRSGAGK